MEGFDPDGGVCPHCQGALRPGAKFCGHCGHRSVRPSAKLFAPAPAPTPTPVGMGSGLAPALLAYFACLIALLVLMVMARDGHFDVGTLRIFDYVIIGFGVVSLLAFPESSRALLAVPKGSLMPIVRALGVLGVIIVVLQILKWLVPSVWEDEVLLYRQAGKTLSYVLVDYAVLPPIGEELIFRGVVLTGLSRALGERTGTIVSSLLFATLHVSPLSFVHLSLVGILLARVRWQTQSIYPCIILHGAYNATLIWLDW